jgi:hypothetical protein
MVAIIFRDIDGKQGVILCRDTAHLEFETKRLERHQVDFDLEYFT